jgi:putative tryptophan/tyrosine transport system substrate-binding protein
MKRREFIALVGGAAALWPLAAPAQSMKMLRVSTAFPLPRTVPFWVAFEKKMAALGYREGQNFTFDYVQSPGFDGLETAYREVVARQPDILVAAGPEQSLIAARAAGGTLPIVTIAVDYDPIVQGHVANMARPGGNITGVYFQSNELMGKRLQLLKEVVPGMTAATVFWDQAATEGWAALQAAAPGLGLRLTGVELRERPYDYERAIADVPPAERKVLIAAGSPFFFQDRAILAELGLRLRTPVMLNTRDSTLAGGLMSYGPSLPSMFELAASYVDRIAKGDKPADLPILQPTKFDLIINLKTAAALGLTIPAALLAQADEVIE